MSYQNMGASAQYCDAMTKEPKEPEVQVQANYLRNEIDRIESAVNDLTGKLCSILTPMLPTASISGNTPHPAPMPVSPLADSLKTLTRRASNLADAINALRRDAEV